MARPRRLELAGALHHATSRGAGRDDIYLSDQDRLDWLNTLAQVCERFNRRHQRVGHVFQGRFKAVLVEKDSHLLERARYVVLNPLRAKMMPRLKQWPWSSYLATCGQAAKPDWLQTDFLLSQFTTQRSRAIAKYIGFAHPGKGLPSVWERLQGQVYLGSAAFILTMQGLFEQQPHLDEIPRRQRRVLQRALADFAQNHPRDDAIALAYLSGQYTMAAIADHFGVH